MQILLAGGHGFIGRHLKSALERKGHSVASLARKPDTIEPYWDPEKEVLDLALIEQSDVIINLCGESVLGFWSHSKELRFKRSRLLPTALLCSKIEQAIFKPKVYIAASAIGYYGDTGEGVVDESNGKGKGFFADLVEEWEGIAHPLPAFGVRTLFLRLGIVLGRDGGALKGMLPAFRSGLGGKIGSGNQWMSWVEIQDVVHAFEYAIENEKMSGVYNCVAPNPIRNQIFTQSLGQILHAPTHFTIPKWVLHFIFGKAGSLFLDSQKVFPKRLLDSGFHFEFPELVGALRASCRREKSNQKSG